MSDDQLIVDRVYLNYTYTRDGRVRDRFKAVLLCSEGWTTPMISQALRLHETSIIRHLEDYLASGKLSPENGGSVSSLSDAQTKQVIQHLADNTYCYSHQIVDYIEATQAFQFSIPDLNKWLHTHGFSYKKPNLTLRHPHEITNKNR